MQRPTSPSALTIWLTGIPAAGKTTLGRAVVEALRASGCAAQLLDGDEIRRALFPALGFSRADRDTNIDRLIYLAHMFASNSVIPVVAAVSPYGQERQRAREALGRFVEVHVHCPIEVAIARDPKGLYRRALAGEIADFTGVNAPYEPPGEPEVLVDTAHQTVEECVAAVMRCVAVAHDMIDREAAG